MTTIGAEMARSYTPDMFDDLDVPAHVREYDKRTGITTLAFDGELGDETVRAIRARMTSRNDIDQEARANLCALSAVAAEAEFDAEGFAALRDLCAAAMAYFNLCE